MGFSQLFLIFLRQMFVSSTENKATECEAGLVNLVFADDATDSVISTANIPTSGKYRGSSRMLNTFEGTLMSGEWKLSVVSKSIHPDEYMGSLLHWGLRIEAKPCVASQDGRNYHRLLQNSHHGDCILV